MQCTTSGSLVYYQFHNLLPFTDLAHGIFTRLGGKSLAPWYSLNTGHTVGDSPEAVDTNHRLICEALGFATGDLVSPYQVHGAGVAAVDASDRGRVIPETDALVTDAPGVLLMLRFADCTPIWLHDPVRGAIGLAHAGWRGTVAGTVREAVRAMRSAFGCRPADLIAGIGPAIGPCCYEVGEDVAIAFRAQFRDAASQFLAPQENHKWYLDLWAANRYHLIQEGVERIEVAQVCTACHTGQWFSHRAERGRTGRIGALIGLRE